MRHRLKAFWSALESIMSTARLVTPLLHYFHRDQGRGKRVGWRRGVGRGRGVTLGIAVGVGVEVPPSVTVGLTGSATSGRTGSLPPMPILA